MSEGVCNYFVSWWDGEYEGNCELEEGHKGPHWDGLSWYNDDWDLLEPWQAAALIGKDNETDS